jgi:hypothetical protein
VNHGLRSRGYGGSPDNSSPAWSKRRDNGRVGTTSWRTKHVKEIDQVVDLGKRSPDGEGAGARFIHLRDHGPDCPRAC